jgi:hypothetical protein
MMGRYRVLVRGANFLLELEGERRRFGFYATRFVRAASRQEAEAKAVELVRSDEQLITGVLNEADDPPMLYVEEAEKLGPLRGLAGANAGFTFYREEPGDTTE